MQNKQYFALCLVVLVMGQTFALPQQTHQVGRKFAEKPNSTKKVANAIDDIEDVGSNSIQEGGVTGFPWGGLIGTLMQLFLGQTAGVAGPSKNEIDEGVPSSPWANLLSVGLRILTAILGGPQQSVDGIDKVDNANASPMQDILRLVLGAFLGQARNPDQVSLIANQASEFIHIVINLLDALKTSFSHRSFRARSLGSKDSIAEAAAGTASMFKGFLRSFQKKMSSATKDAKSMDDTSCFQRYMCEANAECSQVTSPTLCRLVTLVTASTMTRTMDVNFEPLDDAGRKGRSNMDCAMQFECNAV